MSAACVPASRSTMHFIDKSTGQSSIMKVQMCHLHAGFGSEVPVEYLQIRAKRFDRPCEIAATAAKPLGGD